MRLDALTVALRPRSPWEAVELGTALVRRNARAVWTPWFAVTLPAFLLVNALMHALGVPALAVLVMWWLKPLFDRVPLFVLSRAVFGEVPTLRMTLRDAFRGAGAAMLGYLTWRRFGPARALLMPVDVLEGGERAQAAARRRVVGGPAYGVAALTLLVFLHFEAALTLGLAALVFLFIPEPYLAGSLQAAWQVLQDAPAWLHLANGALVWLATSLVEPFSVGAGFGLYLNRRTEIEGWDIEIAFRRLRERLLAGATGLVLACAVLMPPGAQARPPAPAVTPARPAVLDEAPLAHAYGPAYSPDRGFDRAVERAYADPTLTPRRKVATWKPRRAPEERPPPDWLAGLGRFVATAGEVVLWLLAGLLVLLLALTARRWWPWLRDGVREPAAPAAAPRERELPAVEALPEDIVGAARAHWAVGRPREALAIVYRAAVDALRTRTARPLPPGATEAQCLRAAAALEPGPREAFAGAVRQWQLVAYAERVPGTEAFEAMLARVADAFGWPR